MQKKFQWWKLVVGFILFLFFHQVSGLVGGGTLGAILGEGIESIYAHMKMYFYAYLVISAIDYFNLSCHLEEVEGSSKDEQSELKFKTLGCHSMDMFGQELLHKATCGFNHFSVTSE